jgi:AcrR family transcriptional regulator
VPKAARVRRPAPRKRARTVRVERADRIGRAARTTYHHGDLRRALIDAAASIIGEVGAEAFTLREAARRIGVNHRAAYRHFEDKATLLAAVAEQGFRELIDAARAEVAAVTGDDVEARILAAARAYVQFAAHHPAHFRVMFGPRLNESGHFTAVDALVREAYLLLEGEVRAGMASGRFAQDAGPHPMVALWSGMHGLASLVLMKRVEVPDGRLGAWVDRVMGKVVRGLR